MRQLVRGERAPLSDLAAIHHLWEVEVSVQAPMYIVDFACLGLDENGEVFDDDFIIHLNRPDAPRGAIQLNNASNNGAVFSLRLEDLPPRVRRLVFTASIGENPIPGGLVGAAFSLLGVNADIGAGHLILATPVAELAFFEFSGEDFGDERTLVIGELYLREQWRFVAAGQPLKGELGAFLRTLTDGPTPAPAPVPIPTPTPRLAAPPLAPPRVTAPVRPPSPPSPAPVRTAPRPAAPVLLPPPAPPRRTPQPIAPAPATIFVPPAPVAAVAPAPIPIPVAAPAPVVAVPLNWPQSVPPGGKLQDLIDAAVPGSTLLLQRGEYPGPLVIAKPLVLEARDSAVWCKQGPVVTIASEGVFLHDLDIEITVSSEDAGEKGVALKIETASAPLELESVQLRGRIAGLGAGDGAWRLPRALDMGEFAARADNEFRFEIQVPISVTLACSIGGMEISPAQLEAGTHSITLRARDIAPDTLLVGEMEVCAPQIMVIVPLQGQAQSGKEAARGLEIGAN